MAASRIRGVSFEVGADAYDRFMGRYSGPLAAKLVAVAHLAEGRRALDVGCGPGALTAALVGCLGAAAVSAVDPSNAFVAVARSRFPAVDIRRATAERLPFPDDEYVGTLRAVVHGRPDQKGGSNLAEVPGTHRLGIGRLRLAGWHSIDVSL
jgi:trans-aconitate methyltransferase